MLLRFAKAMDMLGRAFTATFLFALRPDVGFRGERRVSSPAQKQHAGPLDTAYPHLGSSSSGRCASFAAKSA